MTDSSGGGGLGGIRSVGVPTVTVTPSSSIPSQAVNQGMHSVHKSAVVWRKVLLVLFMIFELGPYLESLWNGLPSEPIRCGVKEFFHPKN